MTFGIRIPAVYTTLVVSIQFLVIPAYNLQHIDYPRLELELENYSNNYPQQAKTQYRDAIAFFATKRNFSNDVLVYSINSGRTSPSESLETTYIQDNSASDNSSTEPLNSWSVIWYIGSFGGLIGFFLIVSCSEWCCRRHARNRCASLNENAQNTQQVPDTPPPSYDHFAPPAYESLVSGRSREKSEYDIYVVPVHALDTIMETHRQQQPISQPGVVAHHHEDAPPSYLSASGGCMFPAFPPPTVVAVQQDSVVGEALVVGCTSTATGTVVVDTSQPSNSRYDSSFSLPTTSHLVENRSHGNNSSANVVNYGSTSHTIPKIERSSTVT